MYAVSLLPGLSKREEEETFLFKAYFHDYVFLILVYFFFLIIPVPGKLLQWVCSEVTRLLLSSEVAFFKDKLRKTDYFRGCDRTWQPRGRNLCQLPGDVARIKAVAYF